MKKGHHQPVQGRSHGSEPRKPHSRARLRDLGRTWLHTRPSRTALACGRAGNPGGINGRARRQTSSEKEATVAGTFEDREDRSEEHTSELQSQSNLVCRLLLE